MFLLVLYSCLSLTAGVSVYNNACLNFSDYYISFISENCYYEPDVMSNTPEILERHFPKQYLENYTVTTDDGYILMMFRIINPNRRGVVMLEHPFASDGIVWVSQGNESIAIEFWNRGYEVWIPNHRGTWFSMGHVNLTTRDLKYWNYWSHHIGMYDFPKFIEKIAEVSNSTIIFVGYSMSASSSLIYASLQPEHAKKYIKIFVEMAPFLYIKHMRSPLKYTGAIWKIVQSVGAAIGKGAIFIKDSFESRLLQLVTYLPVKDIYIGIFCLLAGGTPNETEPKYVNLIASNLPRTMMLTEFVHFAQTLDNKGNYLMYDYGSEENLLRYNSTTPPEYPWNRINVPVYLISSTHDSIVSVPDTKYLFNKFSPEANVYGKFEVSHLNHFDFLWGKHRMIVFDNIFTLINKI